jgi:hypothetical protein
MDAWELTDRLPTSGIEAGPAAVLTPRYFGLHAVQRWVDKGR